MWACALCLKRNGIATYLFQHSQIKDCRSCPFSLTRFGPEFRGLSAGPFATNVWPTRARIPPDPMRSDLLPASAHLAPSSWCGCQAASPHTTALPLVHRISICHPRVIWSYGYSSSFIFGPDRLRPSPDIFALYSPHVFPPFLLTGPQQSPQCPFQTQSMFGTPKRFGASLWEVCHFHEQFILSSKHHILTVVLLPQFLMYDRSGTVQPGNGYYSRAGQLFHPPVVDWMQRLLTAVCVW
jgi:hypothetical protein